MKPKVYTDIDINEARSPLVRVVHADEWDLLMNELRYLQGERRAVVAYLEELADAAGQDGAFWQGAASGNGYAAQMIERGEHRREEER